MRDLVEMGEKKTRNILFWMAFAYMGRAIFKPFTKPSELSVVPLEVLNSLTTLEDITNVKKISFANAIIPFARVSHKKY